MTRCITVKQPWAYFLQNQTMKVLNREKQLHIELKDQFIALHVNGVYLREEHEKWAKKFANIPAFEVLKEKCGFISCVLKFGKSVSSEKGAQLGPSVAPFLNVPRLTSCHWLVTEVRSLFPPIPYKANKGNIAWIKEKPILSAISAITQDESDNSSDSDCWVEPAAKRQKTLTTLAEQKERNEVSQRILQYLKGLSPDLQRQFRVFFRSKLSLNEVRRLMSTTIGVKYNTQSVVNEKMAVIMIGIAKVFVATLVESAREVQHEWTLSEEDGEEKVSGPLTPAHIMEAFRILNET